MHSEARGSVAPCGKVTRPTPGCDRPWTPAPEPWCAPLQKSLHRPQWLLPDTPLVGGSRPTEHALTVVRVRSVGLVSSMSCWARRCLDSSLPPREQIDTLVVPTLQVSRVGFGEAAPLVGVLEPGVAALGREPPPEGGPFPTLSGDPPAASASRSRRCPPERPGPRPPLLPSRGQLRPSFSATLFPTWLGFPSRWSLGYPPVLPGSPETAALGVSCAERLFPTSRQFHENGPCAMCPSEDPCRRQLRLTPRLTGIS